MKEIQNINCPCTDSKGLSEKTPAKRSANLFHKIALIAVCVGLWFIIYRQLYSFSGFLTYPPHVEEPRQVHGCTSERFGSSATSRQMRQVGSF